MASLHRRANGCYHVRYWENGRQRSFSTRTDDKDAAVAAMEQLGHSLQVVPEFQRPKLKPGIYLLYSPSTGLTKIGCAGNLPVRIRTLKQGSDSELETVAAIRYDDYYQAEKMMHERFADRRVRGEWFRLDGPWLGRAVAEATQICKRFCEHFTYSASGGGQ